MVKNAEIVGVKVSHGGKQGKLYKIMEENEKLTSFFKSYIGNEGFDNDFKSHIAISKLVLLSPYGKTVMADTTYTKPGKNMIVVNTFREEHNNFIIEFHYLIEIK